MRISVLLLFRKAITIGVILYSILILSISCNSDKEGKSLPLFQKLSSKKTNVTFENTLTESETFNYFLYPYIYMGGGVSVADFNNDGLTDIYLVGNMVPNRLYLNRGNFTFEDVTEISNTGGGNRWKLGSTICDINNDGLPDIYVCVSGLSTNHENLLFVNQGINKDGIPVFKEEAKKYGINDPGMSTQATFFDYDNDGDMDLYVANYPITSFKATPYVYKQMMRNVRWIDSGHLYRNNGDGTFTDVTKESGLLSFGLTLSATVGDFNQDGFKDLYISNDFTCPDYFYFNNGDGTFSDKAGEVLGQTSFYGMGVDVADYNNDGLPDIMQIDMAPEDNKRAKMNMSSMPPEDFEDMVKEGLHHQYRYSTLNLNRGILKNNLPFFTNAAWIAGVTSTDWSWAALFADFDLDGWKDLYITNGSRRDMNNADYFNKIGKSDYFSKGSNKSELLEQAKNMPGKPLTNYIFRNNGDLTFTRFNKQWDITETSFSNGVAYADLDNDGDLNTEKGFIKCKNCLPAELNKSGKCVKAADYDKDGHLDLFVGGRVVPGKYPLPANSYILRNNGGKGADLKFENVTKKIAPELLNLGLVTDAIWDDFDGDGDVDLIIVGEWMKIHFFENSSNRFIDVSDKLGFKETVGWWNSINSIDIDKDGDNDYLVGNLGLNYKYKTSEKEPFEIYSNDFDVNGKLDIVLGYTEMGKNYPVSSFDATVRQLPVMKLRYKGYEEFAKATLQEIYGEQMLKASLHYKANTFASYWIENKGKGEFAMHKLPNWAQFSSINDMAEIKYNDNCTAFIVAGNLYGSEVETPRNDASIGLVLLSDAKGEIKVVPPAESTFRIKGEVKVIRKIKLASGKDGYLFAINNDSLKLIEFNLNHK